MRMSIPVSSSVVIRLLPMRKSGLFIRTLQRVSFFLSVDWRPIMSYYASVPPLRSRDSTKCSRSGMKGCLRLYPADASDGLYDSLTELGNRNAYETTREDGPHDFRLVGAPRASSLFDLNGNNGSTIHGAPRRGSARDFASLLRENHASAAKLYPLRRGRIHCRLARGFAFRCEKVPAKVGTTYRALQMRKRNTFECRLGTCLFQSGNGSPAFGNRQAGGCHALRHEAGHETGRRRAQADGPLSPRPYGFVFPLGRVMKVSGQHQEGFHKGTGKPSNLRHDARSPGTAFVYVVRRAVRPSGGVRVLWPAPRREGQDVTVRTKARCRFPAASVGRPGKAARKARWRIGVAMHRRRGSVCVAGGFSLSLYIYISFL